MFKWNWLRIFGLIIPLIGIIHASNLSVSYVHLGYGSVQETSEYEGDDMIEGTLIGLVLCSVIFSYLHINSKSLVWSQLWFLFSLMLMSIFGMALQVFANNESNTTLSGLGLGIFQVFLWIFIIMAIRFIWLLYKEYIDEFLDVLNGRKKIN